MVYAMGSRSQHSAPKTHGAPLETTSKASKPRKRPKVGDKDPSYKKPKPRKKPARKKRPVAKKAENPLVHRRDSEGRPVGGGGHSRDVTMMDKVEEAQRGKRKKR